MFIKVITAQVGIEKHERLIFILVQTSLSTTCIPEYSKIVRKSGCNEANKQGVSRIP
jgi:hypothetical protein